MPTPPLTLLRRALPVGFVLALLLGPAPTVLAQPAADDAVSWGISPAGEGGRDERASIDHVIDPGQALVDHVVIDNYSEEPLTLDVYAADARPADGAFDVAAADERAEGVGAWLTLDRSEVEVPARGHVIVEATLRVPDDAAPGDHAGGILASRRDTTAGEVGLETERRVGARVHLRVTGPIEPRLVVTDLRASYRPSANPLGRGAVAVTYRVRNSGNVRLTGRIEVAVVGPLGRGRWAVRGPAVDDLLPGHTVDHRAIVDGVVPLGRLSVSVTVTPTESITQPLDGSVEPSRARAKVWAVPWAALAVVGAVALLGAGRAWWRRRRETREKAAIMASSVSSGPAERRVALVLLALAVPVAAGCASPETLRASDGRVQVVTTTGILRDLVENVGGDRVVVSSLVPDGGDPHSYEPSLRAIRNVVYADVAFSNYAFLEEHAIIRALDANLPAGVPNVELAEGAIKYAAEIIPLVEDVSLDTIWLGMRVRGTGEQYGATRASEVRIAATGMDGPGDLTAYLTESFGNPEVYVRSADGFDPADGYEDDTAVLPADAHTHMSWVFTAPGVYRLDLGARLAVAPGERPVPIGTETFTFAVGVNPRTAPGMDVEHVLGEGHADLAVDLDTGELSVYADPEGGGDATQELYDPATTVIEVPTRARAEVPGDPQFRFLGDPGQEVYQLPQAVLGKHVHGEIDPHLWQDVGNAISYVELIRDTLVGVDPGGARTYHANAAAYVAELARLDAEVRATIAGVPEARRHLVTTHDAFAYLGHAYDVEISGFVTPNPSAEPSLADRRRLTETVRNLAIPAVFLEPNLAARSSTLVEVAHEEGIEVCPIYGDTFDDHVTTYVEMMRFNAASIRDCLTP